MTSSCSLGIDLKFISPQNLTIPLSTHPFFFSCRKPQLVFDDCMKEKLGIDRPYIGYFARVRLVDTNRPRRILPKRDYIKIKDPPTREELDKMKLNTDQYPLHFSKLFE